MFARRSRLSGGSGPWRRPRFETLATGRLLAGDVSPAIASGPDACDDVPADTLVLPTAGSPSLPTVAVPAAADPTAKSSATAPGSDSVLPLRALVLPIERPLLTVPGAAPQATPQVLRAAPRPLVLAAPLVNRPPQYQAAGAIAAAAQPQLLPLPTQLKRTQPTAPAELAVLRPAVEPVAQPFLVDIDGDGVQEIAQFRHGQWRIDHNHDGRWQAEEVSLMGGPQDLPAVDDWDGDGRLELGLVSPDGKIVYGEAPLPPHLPPRTDPAASPYDRPRIAAKPLDAKHVATSQAILYCREVRRIHGLQAAELAAAQLARVGAESIAQ